MPLDTYEDVAAYGSMIKYVTTTRLMPPWYADTAYSHFANERKLSAEEIRMISDWVEKGMEQGKTEQGKTEQGKREQEKREQGKREEEKESVIISMDQAFEQFGLYIDQYQVFVLPTHLDEDYWVEGIEFVPGNKK